MKGRVDRNGLVTMDERLVVVPGGNVVKGHVDFHLNVDRVELERSLAGCERLIYSGHRQQEM